MKLKISYFKHKFKNSLIKLSIKSLISQKKTDKILVISNEALGDTLIKFKTLEILKNYYGENSFIILCRDKWAKIFELLGYKNLLIDQNNSTLKKILFYRKINNLKYKKSIFISHSDVIKNIDFINNDNFIITPSNANYILEKHQKLLKLLTGIDYSLEELRPNLKEYFLDNNISNAISIGIGASNAIRTLPVNSMTNIVNYIQEKFPNKKIYLLGSGKKQAEYTKELLTKIKHRENIINTIDSIPLLDSLKIIANSDLFIGYDSGLTNAAFCFHTKYICLHWGETKFWWHDFPGCITLIGDETNPYNDGIHGTPILNSIKISQIEKAIKDLKIF